MATLSSASPSRRFGFIKENGQSLGLRYLCAWLNVSRSGYYAWLKRVESKRAIADAQLLIQIRKVFSDNHETYGSRRVFHELKRQGICASRKRVARLMRENGLRARALKTYAKPARLKLFYQDITNNRLLGNKLSNINQQWSGGLTYLKVGGHWHYLAVVIDLYSRRVIGWAFGKSKTVELTMKALRQAVRRRKPKNRVLFHTDRGAEYRANQVQRYLETHNIISSMNRPGCCTDNAEVESFFHSLKADIIRGFKFEKACDLQSRLRSYLDYFYNRQRLHSSLSYKTPAEFELAAQ